MDESNFEDLLERARPVAMRAANRILRSPDLAEEEVQNATLLAWQARDRMRDPSYFSTWFYRITVNCCFQHIRKQKRLKEVSIESSPSENETLVWQLPDPHPGVDETIAAQETGELVRREVNRMPKVLRHVLTMIHLEERGIPETSESIGATVAATKSRLFRARREIRERLEHRLAPVARPEFANPNTAEFDQRSVA
jgi:RNA polymerase sigma-70 factor (ECF subfamily)